MDGERAVLLNLILNSVIYGYTCMCGDSAAYIHANKQTKSLVYSLPT